MPTYTVRTASGRLDAATRATLARALTDAHTAATGAQGFFAQVAFTELDAHAHFVGGAPVAAELVFVHGQIRAGRTTAQKRALLDALTDAVVATLGVRRRAVWVYLVELPPENMVEYGHVLPEAGGEAAWLASLDPQDRAYLEALGR